jgi:pyruvate dehydrogenase E1 component alpha subunit
MRTSSSADCDQVVGIGCDRVRQRRRGCATGLVTSARDIASRGPGYGFPGQVIDGNDIFAVYEATRRAVERALGGGGPTLLECKTYRVGFHNTSDNPTVYRTTEEVERARHLDPIERLRRHLLAEGLLSAEDRAAIGHDVDKTLSRALQAAECAPLPDRSAAFAHVFADSSPDG